MFLESEFLNLPIGILALSLSVWLHFIIPLLGFSILLALFLHLPGRLSWRRATFVGAIFGAVSASALIFEEGTDGLPFARAMLLAGPICGWIYWRIAIQGQLREADAGAQTEAHKP